MKNKRIARGKVGVAKGFGPRHSENAKEGETTNLTKVNTDTVPAMLTPREAVMNRNAAELAGRGNIEALNQEGNQLAKKGVDLAAGGESDVGLSEILKTYQNGGNLTPEEIARVIATLRSGGGGEKEPATATLLPKYGEYHEDLPEVQNPNRARGVASVPAVKLPVPRVSGSGNVMKYVLPGTVRREAFAGIPKGLEKGDTNVKMKSKPKAGGKPVYNSIGGGVPAPPAQGGGFYPPGRGPFGAYAEGTQEVGIGAPNSQTVYGKEAPGDQFKAPDISGFMKIVADEAQKRGITPAQMSQIAQQFGGMGGGGGMPTYGEGSQVSQSLGPALEGAFPGGYQGGISDIGYPPFLMPNAEYHADKGSTWTGAYDPNYIVQRFAGGTSSVPFR